MPPAVADRPSTMPGFHAGRPARNKGRRYPADPPTVEELVAVMRQTGTTPHGVRSTGARRAWAVSMISALSMPWR
jgi:hypothetical protein